MESTNCIICNKSSFDIFKLLEFDNKKFTLVKCLKCSLVFLNPRLNESDIGKYYNENYKPFQKKKNFINSIYKIIRHINFYIKKKIIIEYVGKNKNNLDIGSGDSFFSKKLNDLGWVSSSYDKFNPCDTDIKSLLKLNKKSFNSITMWHSIEHMYDINSVFKNVNNILSDSGFLFIACPNIDSKEVDYLNNNWAAYDLPRHIYHFNYNSMSIFLEKHGFTIEKVKNLKIDTFYNIFMSRNTNALYKILILFRCFVNQLINIKKSSSLVYVCKKI